MVKSKKLIRKKTGRPTLLHEELIKKKTIDTISALRLEGAPVSSSVITTVV